MEGPSSITACIPEALDFGFCPIFEETKKTITLQNAKSKNPSKVSILNNSPFSINPQSAIVPGRGKLDLTISYTPREANVVVATVVFQIQNEEDKIMKLSAIGKYSYITLNKNTFHFGELLIGQSETKNLVIKNQSSVSTTFHIEEDTDILNLSSQWTDSSFSFDYLTGVIPAGGTFLVKIKYNPSVVYCLSSKNYIIKAESGNSQRFAVLGSGVGLQVSLSSRVCNFGEVKALNSTSRLVTLENNSEVHCSYKFFTDPSSVFQFKKTEGTINAKSNTRLVIYFKPKETVSYYSRVFCIVKNHMVLFIDLIGTCYDILQRPLPLSQKDIEAFRNHVLMGSVHKLVETAPALMNQPLENVFAVSAEIPMDEPNQIALHKEMLQELKDRMIGLSEEFIDFGFTLSGRSSEAKAVTVMNRLQFPVHIMWLIPGETQPDGPCFFSVRPSSASIPGESSATFFVSFSPNAPGSYFFQFLSCQVYIKRSKQKEVDELGRMSTSQTYGKQNLNILTIPPIPLSVPVVGHSFPSNYQTFIPEIKVSPAKKIKFPPCSPGDTMYQSLQIFNQADTPCYYKTIPDPSGIFKVFPAVGFISPKTFTILAVEFKPKVPANYKFQVKFLMNHASNALIKISLEGVCSDPSIFIDNEAKIFYPPLYTGVTSKQKVGILNSSHIAIDFNIEIPEGHREELNVEPYSGTMYPHERISTEFTFTPLHEKNYRFNVPIRIKRVIDMAQDANYVGFFNPGSGKYLHNLRQDPLEKVYMITVIGTGGTGMVQMNPKNIDFKTVSVGFSDLKSFILSNVSNCAICVKLVIVPKDNSAKSDPAVQDIISSSFIFDFKEGILAANSNQKVNLRFVPNCRSKRDYFIQCMAKQNFPNSSIKETPLNEDSRIELSAHGDFPVITILDLRNKHVSPSILWKQFNLKNTIKAILSPLTQVEIKFNNAELTQAHAQERLSHFEWDFGKLNYQRNNLEPKRMRLTLQNIGGVKASFKFVFPDDNKLEIEAWADTGDPEPAAALEDHILKEGIFEVKPKECSLEIGEKIDVELKYHGKEIGQHSLNVFFQIIHGKPIVLTLKGETLPTKRGFLELRDCRFEFEPQPIGLGVGITQPVELRNVGDNKVTFEVDTSALDQFTKSNYDFSIFEIQNKEGHVEANEQNFVFINFKPLESKTYKVSLPIIVRERNTVIQNLKLDIEGRGFHAVKEPKPAVTSIFHGLPLCRISFLQDSSQVGFTIEEISFDKMHYGVPTSRIVALYNKNPSLELKFTFKETDVICGDDIVLEPLSGTVSPGSQMPIKLTLNSSRIPATYEGELECVVSWESIGKVAEKNNSRKTLDNKESVQTESLFLRIRKECFIEKSPMEIIDSEPELLKNIFREAISGIISDESTYELLDKFNSLPRDVMMTLSNKPPPSLTELYSLEDIGESDEKDCEPEYSSSRLFLMDEFKDLSYTILENTLFNIVSEAIYQESDLCSIGKTYIRMKPSIN